MILIGTMTTPPITPPAPSEDEKDRKKKELEKGKDHRAMTGASSELLFVFLPFIVIGITLAHRGEIRAIFFIPEWSIVSAVIAGQAIVKLASVGVGRPNVKKETIILFISVLLVCLLVPILVVLAIALTSPNISTSLAVTQAVFFSLSSLIFWLATFIENVAEQ